MNPKIRSELRKVAPAISFAVEYQRDPNFRWDGDGPDPTEEGFDAYDVAVSARAIDKGDMIEGIEYLGGVYEKPGKFDPDIGGYLPQMLEEAATRLAKHKGISSEVKKQAKAASLWLKDYMRIRYELEQAQK